MKIVFIGVYANNAAQYVYGGDILSFHIFEALNDNWEAKETSQLQCHPHWNILKAFWTMQLRFI